MGTDGKLPKGIPSLLSSYLLRDERVRFSQASDLTPERRFGPSYIAVTDIRIVVFAGFDTGGL